MMSGIEKGRFQKLLFWFLRWFCKPDLVDSIAGDLEELYLEEWQSKGRFRSNLFLFVEVLKLFRPSMIRSFSTSALFDYYQLTGQFRVAARILKKKKEYTIINSLGLAIGIAGFLLIVLFVKNEYSYDHFLENNSTIHKVVLTRSYPDRKTTGPYIPHSFANVIVSDFPEVIRSTVLSGPYHKMPLSILRSDEEKDQYTESVMLADSNFFKVFSFKMLKGDAKAALNDPLNMVLTESVAKKYFGSEEPIGKTITTSGRDQFIVTGVCEDPPSNSHFKFGVLSSIQSIGRFGRVNFTRPDVMCYVQLSERADAKYLEGKLPSAVDRHISSQIEELNQMSWEEYQAQGNGFLFSFCPLLEVHLNPHDLGGMKVGGNILTNQMMLAVAILILFLAVINFVNLSTARSSERAKEVSVRKIMGSGRRSLVVQFLIESLILSFMASIAAWLLVELMLPSFNALMDTSIHLAINLESIMVFVSCTTALAILAGVYPALMLSRFNPLRMIRNIPAVEHGLWLRNGLVVFQFWVSGILIIVLLVVQQQVSFMSEKSLGFDEDDLIVMEGVFQRDPSQSYVFMENLRQLSCVEDVGSSISFPSIGGNYSHDYRTAMTNLTAIETLFAGDHFMETMNFELLKGKFFDASVSDSLSVILNESAVLLFGLSDPIGKKIEFVEQTYGTGVSTSFKIKGVVKDFNIEPLRKEIKPLVIKSTKLFDSRMRYITFRVNTDFVKNDLLTIQSLWESTMDKPFQFRFVDQVLDAQYKKEQLALTLFRFFSGLSIFIACMGLYGLTSFACQQRTKEIGIRKVVGASAWRILGMLGMDFTKRVLLAFVLAAPMAWYLLQHWWLSSFAYSVELGAGVFVVAGLFALGISWLTVFFQSIKTARLNPSNMLRND